MIARAFVLGAFVLNVLAAGLTIASATFHGGSWWPLVVNVLCGAFCWWCYGSVKESQASIARSKARIAEIDAEIAAIRSRTGRWSS